MTDDTLASPAPGLPPMSEAASLRMAIFRLARRLRTQRADDTMSDAHIAVLATLYKNGPTPLGTLAAQERVSAPSMNRTVNGLADSGYVARTTDAEDGRKVNILLTDSGREVIVETVARRNAWLEGALAELTSQEHDLLMSAATIMRKVADR